MPARTAPDPSPADARGVALPLSLLGLLVLTAVVIGVAAVAATEPTIAANHLRVAEARTAAEAGIEHAAWALGHPESPAGLPDPLPGAVPAPYDGSRLVPLAIAGRAVAGFRVTVQPGGGPAERAVSATGFAPDDTAPGRARQRIQATLHRLRYPDPPAAVTAAGALEVGGAAAIDARGDVSCGARAGAWSGGSAAVAEPARVWGADGNAAANEPTDLVSGAPAGELQRYAPSAAELAAMRAYARAHGTYYRGRVLFGGARPMPDGLVFVDTVSGDPVGPATPDADLAAVDLTGPATADPGGVARGWLIVAGTLRVAGGFRMRGFVYAQRGLDIAGDGTARLVGAALSGGAVRLLAPAADPALVQYDCAEARTGGGAIPAAWTIKPGSYRELPG
jgi:hypothetical protein